MLRQAAHASDASCAIMLLLCVDVQQQRLHVNTYIFAHLPRIIIIINTTWYITINTNSRPPVAFDMYVRY